MSLNLTLVGDINLMGVSNPSIPFRLVKERLSQADVLFANLECCFYESDAERSVNAEGFYANRNTCEALQYAGVNVVGNANNVNYGPEAIRSSLECLDGHGIPYTGAGRNRAQATRSVIIERGGVRFGFLQRTSVFWTHGHEADDDTAGVATLAGHTAYRPRREDLRTLTRPGCPPEIITWADPEALEQHRADIQLLRQQCDILVASQHWGLDTQVLRYQRDIAHNAIHAGADIVFGHGPHSPLAVECYDGCPIIYGAGSFSFETGHRASKHPDWLGLMVEIEVAQSKLAQIHLQFVRHNDANETYLCAANCEPSELTRLTTESATLNARLEVDGERVRVQPT